MCLNNCIKGTDVLNHDIQVTNYMTDMVNNCDYMNSNKTFESDTCDLTILHTNIRGISSKLSELHHLIDNCASNTNPKIITVCETWLTLLSPKIRIPGYNFVSKCRTGKWGGGVGILISDNHLFKHRDDLESIFSQAECCVVGIKLSHGPLVVCSLYRPPNTETTGFIKEFESFSNSMLKEKQDWIVGTDHKIDFLKSNTHKNTQSFIDKLLDCRMIPTIMANMDL